MPCTGTTSLIELFESKKYVKSTLSVALYTAAPLNTCARGLVGQRERDPGDGYREG